MKILLTNLWLRRLRGNKGLHGVHSRGNIPLRTMVCALFLGCNVHQFFFAVQLLRCSWSWCWESNFVPHTAHLYGCRASCSSDILLPSFSLSDFAQQICHRGGVEITMIFLVDEASDVPFVSDRLAANVFFRNRRFMGREFFSSTVMKSPRGVRDKLLE